MGFPFQFSSEAGDVAVDVGVMVASDRDTWTWLQSSRSGPVRLEPSEWPDGLARSVDIRNQARAGQRKGRVLVVRHSPRGRARLLAPVAVLCWHAHPGNWPLTVLDVGYRLGLDAELGQLLVVEVLLAALADLNDRVELRDRKVPRPDDRLGWAIRRQDGAGADPAWARTVATRAQLQWGFAVVKPKSRRPTWARQGFYAERPR
jgi:hypothetical protein